MAYPPDDRAPLLKAVQYSSRVTTIALEMVVPGLIGLWIDRKLGTVMVFLVLGMVLGMVGGVAHLIQLGTSFARDAARDTPPGSKPAQDDAGGSGRTPPTSDGPSADT